MAAIVGSGEELTTMRLTKLTGHAIRVLVHCARAGDTLIKTAAVSSEIGIAGPNMFKIVHALSNAGFIKAVRGPRGGIKLARPADMIPIGEVVRAIEVTSVEVNGWDGERGKGGRKTSAKGAPGLNSVLDEALEAFVSVLDQHTIADMALKPNTETPNQAGTRRVKTLLSARRGSVAGKRRPSIAE